MTDGIFLSKKQLCKSVYPHEQSEKLIKTSIGFSAIVVRFCKKCFQEQNLVE